MNKQIDMKDLMEKLENINEDTLSYEQEAFHAGYQNGLNDGTTDNWYDGSWKKAYEQWSRSRDSLGHDNALGNDHEPSYGETR